MPAEPTVVFANEDNKETHKQAVLQWLESDFLARQKPQHHFWHNRNLIGDSFNECQALVILNNRKNVVGFMTWDVFNKDGSAEISIVEVKKTYRRRGLFKKMVSAFADKFDHLVVLTASVIPQSELIFERAGWQFSYNAMTRCKKHFKVLRPTLSPVAELPSGRVIAVCCQECYSVQREPDKYKHEMKYFPIDIDDQGKLKTPIVIDLKCEAYIAIYLDRELIVDGKAKHLFEGARASGSFNLLVLSDITFVADKKALLAQKGFIPPSTSIPPAKRIRLSELPTLFSSANSGAASEAARLSGSDEASEYRRKAPSPKPPSVE